MPSAASRLASSRKSPSSSAVKAASYWAATTAGGSSAGVKSRMIFLAGAGSFVVPVAAGTDALIGPLPKNAFGRTSGADKGRAYVDYSSQASVTRAVVKP